MDQPEFRLSDSLEVWEVAELFYRAIKEESKQKIPNSLKKENIAILEEQAWAEMCVYFWWDDIKAYYKAHGS